MKKIIALLLVVVMILSLAACAANTETPAAEEPKAEEAQKAEEPKAEASEETTEPIHLKWYLGGSAPQPDQETVSDAMEAYILENYGLNYDLELVVTDFGSYSDKAQMIIASGEEYDIMWTSNWCNNYYTNVGNSAFIPLDDLITDELKNLIPAGLLDACKIDGKLYGIPSYQIAASQNVLSVPTRYVEEFNLDVDSIKSLADMNDFLYQVKEAYPDMYPLAVRQYKPFYNILDLSNGYQVINGVSDPGAVLLDGDLTVVNQYELPVTMANCKLAYQWCQDGIIRMDAAAITDDTADVQAGLHAVRADTSWKPYMEVEQEAVFGEPVTCIKISDAWSTTGNAVGTINAISVNSKHPAEAMQFLSILNTDAGLYNLLCFGIEGVHYTLNADGTATSDDSAGYNPNCDWVFGCQFNAYPREGQQSDIWEQTKAFSDSAKPSPIMGFAFDTTPVANEIAACATVFEQYISPIYCGSVDPEIALPEALEMLKTAGSEKILAEMQSQLDAWAAANGK